MASGPGAGFWYGKTEHSTGAIGLPISLPALVSKITPMAPRTSDRFFALHGERTRGDGEGEGLSLSLALQYEEADTIQHVREHTCEA